MEKQMENPKLYEIVEVDEKLYFLIVTKQNDEKVNYAMANEDRSVYQQEAFRFVPYIAINYFGPNEKLHIALKGKHHQYLIATDRALYIYKKGWMTGNTFGESVFHIDFQSMTSIQCKVRIGNGYIEVVTPGTPNRKNIPFYGGADELDNCISFGSGNGISLFETGTKYIKELAFEAKNPKQDISDQIKQKEIMDTDVIIEEIRKYKQLFDEGILTEEEFAAKKKQLLSV